MFWLSKIYLKTKKWNILHECNINIKHDTFRLDYFYEKFLSGYIENFNMKLKKIQNFYIRSLFKDNQDNDTNLVKSLFKRKFNIPLILTNSEITKQKHLAIGGNKDTDILDIC